MVTVVCSVATGVTRVRFVVAGHSRTMAYTASALDVYLEINESSSSYSVGILYNIIKKVIHRVTKTEKGKTAGDNKIPSERGR